MSVRDSILSLLSGAPAYGYELKAGFEAATGNGWPLNIGQVYSTLQRCERDGLATGAEASDDQGRRLWTITQAGHDAINDWMRDPHPPVRITRDTFSLKVLMAIETRPNEVGEIVQRERSATMAELQSLTRDKSRLPSEALAERLQVDRSILLVESQVRWLDMVEARIESLNSGAKDDT